MRNQTLLSAALAAAVLACAQMPAHAQPRTWVSGLGSDANPCSRTQPCQTFAGAMAQTAAGGTISVLDPGGYGAVTITKALNIINDGSGEAGILTSGNNGITINAGPNDVVILRGLVIDGGSGGKSAGLNGIQFNSGAALHLSNSLIKNFTSPGAGFSGIGLLFAPSGASQLFVSDTTFANNGFNSIGGAIFVVPAGGGSATASISRVNMENNQSGLLASTSAKSGQIHIAVRDSVSSGAAYSGFSLNSQDGAQTLRMLISRSEAVNNKSGISVNGPSSAVLLSDSSVWNNGVGLDTANGGLVLSYKTNRIDTNGAPGTPPTVIPLQ